MADICCENLSIGYGADVVQSGITFSIESGSYVCILGENGAGKTTLVKTLLGLLKPMGGKLYVSPEIKSEGIGYLPQQGVVPGDFPTTVEEVVLSGNQRRAGLFYKQADRDRANTCMEKLGVLDLRKRSYQELSGGQKQRVMLARALCVSDRILVLDEPVTGLDIKNQDLLYEMVEQLNKSGVTILMISHDKDVLSKSATHLLRVEKTGVVLEEVAG